MAVSGGNIIGSSEVLHDALGQLVISFGKKEDISRDTFVRNALNTSEILFSQLFINELIDMCMAVRRNGRV